MSQPSTKKQCRQISFSISPSKEKQYDTIDPSVIHALTNYLFKNKNVASIFNLSEATKYVIPIQQSLKNSVNKINHFKRNIQNPHIRITITSQNTTTTLYTDDFEHSHNNHNNRIFTIAPSTGNFVYTSEPFQLMLTNLSSCHININNNKYSINFYYGNNNRNVTYNVDDNNKIHIQAQAMQVQAQNAQVQAQNTQVQAQNTQVQTQPQNVLVQAQAAKAEIEFIQAIIDLTPKQGGFLPNLQAAIEKHSKIQIGVSNKRKPTSEMVLKVVRSALQEMHGGSKYKQLINTMLKRLSI